jgi:hypothetical protein
MNTTYHPDNFDHAHLAQQLLADQPVLSTKLSTACQIDPAAVTDLTADLLRFLNLIAFAGETLTPSQTIDLVWHEFILCTRTYESFCQHHFGRMIHHEPGGDETTNRHRFSRALQLYTTYFGAPSPAFKGTHQVLAAADCGACQGV